MDYRISHYTELNKKTQWTSVSDVVEENNFEETFDLYKNTEDKYINIFKKLLNKNNITKMNIYDLEKNGNNAKGIYNKLFDRKYLYKIKNGDEYSIKDIFEIIRLCLREIIWCKIVWEDIYIHIGYDYYTYIGGLEISDKIIKEELENGITIEEYRSPYLLE
jgi:hypothetical protein